MKICFLLFLSAIACVSVKAQEMWGISNSNYSGNMGLSLNPSTIVSAPYKYEINLLSADIFVQNNLVYIPAKERMLYRTASGELVEPRIELYEGSTKSASVYGRVIGPSFIYNAGKWAAAIHTGFRTEVGAFKVPYSINRFANEDKINSPSTNYTTPKFSAAGMAWAETGITYGIGGKTENGFLKGAATLNYLSAFDGMYLAVNSLSYSMDDSTFNLHDMDATYAHAMNTSFAVRGRGMSTTLGVTYIHQGGKSSGDKSTNKKYKYRAGFSLIDIGKVRFTGDAQQVHLQSSGGAIWENFNSAKFGSIQRLDTALVNNLGGSVNNDAFNIWLPMAVSAQFDYPLSQFIYTNFSVVNRLHFMPNQIARPNQVAASIRFESRLFETAFNVSLYEYSQPSVGAAIRFMFFVVGTDRLPELASIADLKSMDIYFGIRFSPLGFSKKKSKPTATCPAYKADTLSYLGL